MKLEHEYNKDCRDCGKEHPLVYRYKGSGRWRCSVCFMSEFEKRIRVVKCR